MVRRLRADEKARAQVREAFEFYLKKMDEVEKLDEEEGGEAEKPG